MIHFILSKIDTSDPNKQQRDLTAVESDVNAFVKNATVKALTVTPMIQALDTDLYVGAMIDYQMAPR